MILLSKLEIVMKHMSQAYHFEINKSNGQHPYKHTILLLLTECAALIISVLLHYFTSLEGKAFSNFAYMDMRIQKYGFRAPTSSNQPNKFFREKLHLYVCV